jgi:hypothetical protein
MGTLSFKAFFEDYKGPGGMFDNLGIPRDKMAAVIAGGVFMIGDDKSGQVTINGKTYSAPLMARIERDDDYQEDDQGNFQSGNMVIMPGTMPTQTNKIAVKDGDDMAQAPEDSGEETVHINAERLKELLGLGFPDPAAAAAAGGDPMGGGMPGGGMM